jgi:hypothetical protein
MQKNENTHQDTNKKEGRRITPCERKKIVFNANEVNI